MGVKDWRLLKAEVRFGLETCENPYDGNQSEQHDCATHHYVPFSVQVGNKNFKLCVLRDTG